MTDLAEKNRRASESDGQLQESKLKDNRRSRAEKDRDRILYCSAFRRLSGVTQVISPNGKYPTHNRLTHSLHVAQIARAIASNLTAPGCNEALLHDGGLIDVHTVEAAALAHDLGHPPFGHVAEKVLDRKVVEAGLDSGFEGNAQTFRILTRLAAKPSRQLVKGLDLTRGTLSAVSKYPWLRGDRDKKPDKWGAYETQKEDLKWSREHLIEHYWRPQDSGTPIEQEKDLRTLEAQVMDYADDVAYAVEDVEDFYRVDYLQIDRLLTSEHEIAAFMTYHCEKRNITSPDEQRREEIRIRNFLFSTALGSPYTGSLSSRALLRQFTSTMIEEFIWSVELGRDVNGTPALIVAPETEQKIHWLKDLIGFYVIYGQALASQRRGQATIIKTLFDNLCVQGADGSTTRVEDDLEGDDDPFSEKFDDTLRIMPRFYRDEIREKNFEDTVIVRSAADVIAGLTEAQAIDLYRRMTGHSLGSALDPILA